MIYEVRKLKEKIASRFFLFCQHVTRLNLKKRYKKLKPIERRRKRSPTSTQRERNFNFWSTTWGKLLVNLSAIEGGPLITSREGKLFRRRFRVPWDVFCDLVKKSTDSELFGKNARMKYDFCGRSICPIAIKVLGILRILGRNWCCDDVAEASGMGESTVRLNFHTFISNFVERYYDDYIHRPSGQKLANMMKVYEKMGLPGCIGSTDCVHVKWDRCPLSLTNLCKGKEGYPTLSYSCTVDHHRKILGVTRSNWGTRNDKTIVRVDTYITDVHKGKVNSEIDYNVLVDGGFKKMRGVYYLCDGGYHKWTCMMNPMKHTSSRDERLWSEWVESTRKDVECCFGILKGRFRFLKQGILLQTQHKIDTAFFTCCILHNMILEADGLDKRWEDNVEWDVLNPQPGNSDEGFDEIETPNQSISNQERRILDRVAQYESAIEIEYEGNEVDEEIDVDFESKRKILINHFKKAYDKGLVHWPRAFAEEKKKYYNKAK
jgi:hypothetical protein